MPVRVDTRRRGKAGPLGAGSARLLAIAFVAVTELAGGALGEATAAFVPRLAPRTEEAPAPPPPAPAIHGVPPQRGPSPDAAVPLQVPAEGPLEAPAEPPSQRPAPRRPAGDSPTSFLPLDRSRLSPEERALLQPPFGFTAFGLHSVQDFRLRDVRTPGGAPVAIDRSTLTGTTYGLVVDAWLLSFLNLYGTLSGVDVDADFSNGGSPVASVEYSGRGYGFGAALAAGGEFDLGPTSANLFGSLDFSYVRNDFDVFEQTVQVYTVAPRVGTVLGSGRKQITPYLGCMYRHVTEDLTASLLGQTLRFRAEPVGAWRGLAGLQYQGFKYLVLQIEAGFGQRQQVLGSATVRF